MSLNSAVTALPAYDPPATVLQWIGKLLWPYRQLAMAAVLALLVGAGTWLAMGQGVQLLVDRGFGAAESPLRGADGIDQAMALILGLAIVGGIASFWRFYLMTWLGERISADLRRQVYGHLLRLSPQFYQQIRTGEVISRFTADTTVLQNAIGMSISMALRSSVTALGGLVMMLYSSLELTLYVLLAVPMVLVPIKLLGQRVRRYSRASQDAVAAIGAHVDENLHAIHTVQSYGYEAHSQQRFDHYLEQVLRAAGQRIRYRAWLLASVLCLSISAITVVAWRGAYLVLDGAMSNGEISAFLFYAMITAGAVATLSEVLGEVQRARGAGERLLELFCAPVDIDAPEVPQPAPATVTGALTFKQVSFAYPSDPQRPALSEVSLQIQAGERIALVGASGAGKSTILQLLQRFYQPQQGQILLDGIDLAAWEPSVLRRQFALVPQEPVIFADSVMENIRFGRPSASDEEVQAAAMAAAADAFIQTLSDGYQTQLAERGVRLSGGQKQRLAIARAMLSARPLLLLDEATSALDSQSEQGVQQGLSQLMKGKTAIIIAHRLATVQDADRIVVLDNGRIEAIGSHAQLMQQSALYASLAQLQLLH